ncbi:MAG: isoprenyl transferase [Pseudomonadota bacterium]|nr:isoprenyl transferase [Pseudomonadota bacterium]MDE3037221.1 isoprenyl transferase [Pseudomonadota bacterium]
MKRQDSIVKPLLTDRWPLAAANSIPRHVAVIMDGNGRWAKSRGLPRTAGHKKGADALRNIMNACRNAGVSYLTIYAFSSENWKRPESEISDLMQLLRHYLQQELETLHENKVRLRFIGDLSPLVKDIRASIDDAVEVTAKNSAFNLTVALSYGARQEILRAARRLAEKISSGALKPENISEEDISRSLDTSDLPDPDLLIRTGGEQRLSNFLLWQSAYTEFYFTETLWPDFGQAHFTEALKDYARRERRYGTAEA